MAGKHLNAPSWASPAPRPAGATGSPPPTAGSSPSAMPPYLGSMGGQHLNKPVVASPARRPVRAIPRWRRRRRLQLRDSIFAARWCQHLNKPMVGIAAPRHPRPEREDCVRRSEVPEPRQATRPRTSYVGPLLVRVVGGVLNLCAGRAASGQRVHRGVPPSVDVVGPLAPRPVALMVLTEGSGIHPAGMPV